MIIIITECIPLTFEHCGIILGQTNDLLGFIEVLS